MTCLNRDLHVFLVTIDVHSPETNAFAPENQWLGDEFPFKIVPFQGTFVHCQGVAVYVWELNLWSFNKWYTGHFGVTLTLSRD